MKLSQFKFKLPERRLPYILQGIEMSRADGTAQKDGRNRTPYVQGYFGLFR